MTPAELEAIRAGSHRSRALGSEVRSLLAHVDALTAERDSLLNEVRAEQDWHAITRGRMEDAEERADALQAQLDDVRTTEGALESCMGGIAALTSERDTLQAQFDEARDIRDLDIGVIGSMQTALRRERRAGLDLRHLLAEQQARLIITRASLFDLMAATSACENDRLRAENERLKSERDAARAEVERLREVLARIMPYAKAHTEDLATNAADGWPADRKALQRAVAAVDDARAALFEREVRDA